MFNASYDQSNPQNDTRQLDQIFFEVVVNEFLDILSIIIHNQ